MEMLISGKKQPDKWDETNFDEYNNQLSPKFKY
jgi:hypothetical protein